MLAVGISFCSLDFIGCHVFDIRSGHIHFQSTVNPLLSPPGCLFISSPFEGGGLIETGGLFNLQTTMVSVLHKELEYKVEKLKYKKF